MSLLRRPLAVALLAAALTVGGCATIAGLVALRLVEFAIDRAIGGRLAGVDLSRVRSFSDLGPLDVTRLGAAVARGEVPLEFTTVVAATNPSDNPSPAQLVRLDWTLFLEDRETVSGVFNDARTIQPGQTVDLPIQIRLDLVEFFGRNVRDLAQVALAVAGQNADPTSIRLAATPSITTSLGPIRYPGQITIVSREVGRGDG